MIKETKIVDPTDYVFIIGQNGELKSFYIPTELTNPIEVYKILNIYGIDDVEDITGTRVLH